MSEHELDMELVVSGFFLMYKEDANIYAGLEDVSVRHLSKRWTFEYKFIAGNHEPTTVKDFRGAVEVLRKVHSLGYIHGDVRIENIVFGGGKSYLMDFDLARKEDEHPRYPKGYCDFEIRHRSEMK